jgi:hypothetical protein
VSERESESWGDLDSVSDQEFLRVFPNAEDSYAAFYPWQIKSIDNDGTWDTDDPDIRSNPGDGIGEE